MYIFYSRTRVDGNFLGPGGTVPASQALCSSLLEECFEIAQEIKADEESKYVATSLKPIYDRLGAIRSELESLVLTHRWSLRETDLWNYSLSLQEIDKMRIDGKFVDSDGNRPPGQYVSQLLLGMKMSADTIISVPGALVPLKTMLWSDLSTAVVKRASVGRTYAYCMFDLTIVVTIISSSATGEQVVNCEEMLERSAKVWWTF
jgi:hypothetical protein